MLKIKYITLDKILEICGEMVKVRKSIYKPKENACNYVDICSKVSEYGYNWKASTRKERAIKRISLGTS